MNPTLFMVCNLPNNNPTLIFAIENEEDDTKLEEKITKTQSSEIQLVEKLLRKNDILEQLTFMKYARYSRYCISNINTENSTLNYGPNKMICSNLPKTTSRILSCPRVWTDFTWIFSFRTTNISLSSITHSPLKKYVLQLYLRIIYAVIRSAENRSLEILFSKILMPPTLVYPRSWRMLIPRTRTERRARKFRPQRL